VTRSAQLLISWVIYRLQTGCAAFLCASPSLKDLGVGSCGFETLHKRNISRHVSWWLLEVSDRSPAFGAVVRGGRWKVLNGMRRGQSQEFTVSKESSSAELNLVLERWDVLL